MFAILFLSFADRAERKSPTITEWAENRGQMFGEQRRTHVCTVRCSDPRDIPISAYARIEYCDTWKMLSNETIRDFLLQREPLLALGNESKFYQVLQDNFSME